MLAKKEIIIDINDYIALDPERISQDLFFGLMIIIHEKMIL